MARTASNPDRERRQKEAAERQARHDALGGTVRVGRDGRKARSRELDPALYRYDDGGYAYRRIVR